MQFINHFVVLINYAIEMGTRLKSRSLSGIHNGAVPKVFTQNETNSAGSRVRRRRAPAYSQDVKPRSAGSIPNRLPGLKPSVPNGHSQFSKEEGEPEQDVCFTNVPSAWESDSEKASNSAPPSSARNLKSISAQQILSASMEEHFNSVYEIDIHGAHIGKLENLDKFTRVRILDVSCNYVTVMENLKHNTDLRELKLYDNRIKAIQSLEGLTQLCHLQLQHNMISTLGKGLSHLRKLKVLRIDCNQLSRLDVREIAACSSLTSLNISSNRLDNIGAVNCLPNLEELFSSNNCLRVVSDLSRCKKLQEVDLTNNKLTDITGLKGLPHLRTLHLSHNQLPRMKSFGKSKCLDELYISHNLLTEIGDIADQCPNVQLLDLSNNHLEDFDALCGLNRMSELVELGVAGNPCCREDGPVKNYPMILGYEIQRLEYLDGVAIKRGGMTPRPTTPGGRPMTPGGLFLGGVKAPLMRPMSANAIVTSRQVENQIKALECDIAAFQTEVSKRFESMQSCMEDLPRELSSNSDIRLLSASSTASSSSRLPSRSGKRSRIQAAKEYADSNH